MVPAGKLPVFIVPEVVVFAAVCTLQVSVVFEFVHASVNIAVVPAVCRAGIPVVLLVWLAAPLFVTTEYAVSPLPNPIIKPEILFKTVLNPVVSEVEEAQPRISLSVVLVLNATLNLRIGLSCGVNIGLVVLNPPKLPALEPAGKFTAGLLFMNVEATVPVLVVLVRALSSPVPAGVVLSA